MDIAFSFPDIPDCSLAGVGKWVPFPNDKTLLVPGFPSQKQEVH
jgi:hypothetical protein